MSPPVPTPLIGPLCRHKSRQNTSGQTRQTDPGGGQTGQTEFWRQNIFGQTGQTDPNQGGGQTGQTDFRRQNASEQTGQTDRDQGWRTDKTD